MHERKLCKMRKYSGEADETRNRPQGNRFMCASTFGHQDTIIRRGAGRGSSGTRGGPNKNKTKNTDDWRRKAPIPTARQAELSGVGGSFDRFPASERRDLTHNSYHALHSVCAHPPKHNASRHRPANYSTFTRVLLRQPLKNTHPIYRKSVNVQQAMSPVSGCATQAPRHE